MAQMITMVCNLPLIEYACNNSIRAAAGLPRRMSIFDIYCAFLSPPLIVHTVVLIIALTVTSSTTATTPMIANNELMNLCVNNRT